MLIAIADVDLELSLHVRYQYAIKSMSSLIIGLLLSVISMVYPPQY